MGAANFSGVVTYSCITVCGTRKIFIQNAPKHTVLRTVAFGAGTNCRATRDSERGAARACVTASSSSGTDINIPLRNDRAEVGMYVNYLNLTYSTVSSYIPPCINTNENEYGIVYIYNNILFN